MRTLSLAILALAFPVLTGCGGAKNQVAGTVKYQGKDLTMGKVIFHFPDKKVEGNIVAGKYVAMNTPVGEASVTVEVPEMPKGLKPVVNDKVEIPKDKKTETLDKAPAAAADKKADFIQPVPIDKKYGSKETSGLKFTTKGGTETFNIELP